MITGYKWTARKTDGKLFFVTLECNNEFVDTGEGRKLDKITFYANNKCFYTTDCRVKRIEDEEGNTVESIDGHAFYDFTYYVGQKIKGQNAAGREIRIYYMHDMEYLKTYAGNKWLNATKKLTVALEKWNAAGTKATGHPFFFLVSIEERHRIREAAFFDVGGTMEEYNLLCLEGDII